MAFLTFPTIVVWRLGGDDVIAPFSCCRDNIDARHILLHRTAKCPQLNLIGATGHVGLLPTDWRTTRGRLEYRLYSANRLGRGESHYSIFVCASSWLVFNLHTATSHASLAYRKQLPPQRTVGTIGSAWQESAPSKETTGPAPTRKTTGWCIKLRE